MAEQSIVARKRTARLRLRPFWVLILAALACLPVAFIAEELVVQASALAVSASIVASAALLSIGHNRLQRRDKARLALAMSTAATDPAPVFCTDRHGSILTQNPAAETRFGACQGQPMSRALSRALPNASAVAFRLESTLVRAPSAQEAVVTVRGAVFVTAYRVGSGTIWRVEDGGDTPVRGAAGSLPMMVVSRNGTILSMNDAMRRTLGHRKRALSDVFEHLPVQSGQRLRLRGAEGWIEVVAIDLQSGGDGRREIYILPVDLLPVEDSVAARAFGALPVALVHIAGDGRILAANPRAQTLLNLHPGSDLDLSDVVEGLGRPINDWLSDTLEERIPSRPEMVRACLRDEECFVQITLGRITGEGGPTLLGVLHDATALKSMEQQFVQSQKMQAIGELAGGIAHDFNNLLTAITGHCDLMMLRHDQGEPDFADLAQIQQNANRAASLVGQLLAFSRKQTMRPEIVDLRASMSDLAHLLNRLVGERVGLTLDHDPALKPIRVDRRQLDQVIMNLVVNARDAMAEGGTILVETRVVALTSPLRRDRAEVPPGDYVTIRISDEGVGIPPDQITRIFEPFFTTKPTGEGTGLGLSMVYGIVKQSGGFVFADSVVGKGSAFTLYFPAHDPSLIVEEDLDTARLFPTQLSETGAEAVVLLVEDEASVRAFASRALRLRGFTVLEAENAEVALDMLRDQELAVDIFVTDVIMPGMDGPTWVCEALKTRPDVKVVFVSGYAEDVLNAMEAKVPNSVFLAKPFTLQDLTMTVQRQLP
ncbi:hybrid sensor histidine kinase/response regulator [Nioella nitratireducens]|uniref:hybrid sensor histidine kinase/response regulator n=1 Tax=Nioella nitratireducens TaxID=1287720 RepID=UPI000B2462B7|nr:ATP-binding protein [Nioella nitratireducens]